VGLIKFSEEQLDPDDHERDDLVSEAGTAAIESTISHTKDVMKMFNIENPTYQSLKEILLK
jgi:hypothetical protein